MSDSDDNAFASADEGEDREMEQKPTTKKDLVKSQASPQKTTRPPAGAAKETTDAKKTSSPPSPPSSATSQKEETKKGKGKQQRNKKGKKGAEPKPETKTAESAPTEKTKPQDKDVKASDKSDTTSIDKPSKESGTETAKHSTKDESKESQVDAAGDQKSVEKKTSSAEVTSKDKQNTPATVTPAKQKTGDAIMPAKQSSGEAVKSTTHILEAKEAATPAKKQENVEVRSPEGQSIAPSERDHHTAQQEKVLHRLEETASSSSSGWGWSSWGSSLLSAASNSVQTFTNQVGDGLTTIMDTVETSLGVPDPAALAEQDVKGEASDTAPEQQTVTRQPEEEKATSEQTERKSEGREVEQKKEEAEADKGSGSASNWFSSWGVGDLAKKVQDTGKTLAAKGQNLMTEGFDAVEHLAAGGIDVLETIGKKTYSTLAEHDPSFKRTRQFLSPRANRPNLSSTLREAREQAEKQQEEREATNEALKAHFGTLFDDYQGIAHLEALEILSNQSEKKVHSLLNSLAQKDLADIKPQLLEIKNAFELDDSAEEADEQDFPSLVRQHLSELELGTAPDKLNTVHQMVQAWIQDFDSHDSSQGQGTKETHEKSIQALAELTAKGVEQFHKAGEMVLLDKDADKDCKERAHSLARLTGVLCHEIGNLSNKFVSCLNKLAEKSESEDVTSMITNIYLEASNSSTYIQDAFLLLLPVLQHAALEQSILARTS